MTALIDTPIQANDPHGVFDPHIFRVELEKALDAALAREQGRLGRERRRDRRAASRASAPTATVELHRLPATPTIDVEGWHSDAPRATGEEQDLLADEADPELRAAANMARDGWSVEGIHHVTGREPYEYETVPMRIADAIGRDEDDLSWLRRDEAPAPKGYGMTDSELRRAWVQNARLRYRDALQAALRKHRGRVSSAQANAFPALRSEAQFARSVVARWRFVDELARHGVHDPEAELVRKLKASLAPNYELALARLVERRHEAEAGRLDRFMRLRPE
jgi:hypothetical protein